MGKCLHGELTDGVLRPLTCSFMHMIYVKVQWRQTCTNPVAEVRETAPVLHEIESVESVVTKVFDLRSSNHKKCTLVFN